jgi:hexosaminidase
MTDSKRETSARRANRLLFCALLASGCALAAAQAEQGKVLTVIPWPKSAELKNAPMALSAKTRIVVSDKKLLPLAGVLAEELQKVAGLKPATAEGAAAAGDIALGFDNALKGEAYRVEVAGQAAVRGGTYQAVAWGTVTLLQALTVQDGKVTLPGMVVEDQPANEYRGIMIDAARRRNTLAELKQCVVLCRLYKIRYMHIHLSDNESWTFPSRAFPKLGSSNRGYQGPAAEVYSLAGLKDLVRFADERGVTLIPEIDLPGHTDALRIGHPEVFDADDGKPAHMGIVNMANEKAYEGLDVLVGEVLDVFRSTPYFHFGADEPMIDNAPGSTHYEPYMKKHGLKDSYELYLHFITRMDAIVKKHGRRSMIWADFNGTSTDKTKVPTDVTCMAWQNGSGSGENLTKLGYQVINATWNPLYVVNVHADSPEVTDPAVGRKALETLFNWNLYSFDTCVVVPTTKVIGAQICSWESGGEIQAAVLRWRAPAMSERAWNPGAGKSFADFSGRFDGINPLLDKLLQP